MSFIQKVSIRDLFGRPAHRRTGSSTSRVSLFNSRNIKSLNHMHISYHLKLDLSDTQIITNSNRFESYYVPGPYTINLLQFPQIVLNHF